MQHTKPLMAFLLFFSLLIADVTPQQLFKEFHLSPGKEETQYFYLFNASTDANAGRIGINLSLPPEDPVEKINLRIFLPEPLERGYERVYLFNTNSPADAVMREILLSTNIQFDMHRAAPMHIVRFYDTPSEARLIRSVTGFDKDYEEVSIDSDFETTLTLSRSVDAETVDIVLRLYFGARNQFRDKFHPFVLKTSIETPQETPVAEAIEPKADELPPPEQTADVRDTPAARVEEPPPRPQPATQPVQPQRPVPATEPPTQQQTITRPPPGQAMPVGQHQLTNRLDGFVEQAASIYRAVFSASLEQGGQAADIATLRNYQTQLRVLRSEFDGLMYDPGIDAARKTIAQSEFNDYHLSALAIIATLSGEDDGSHQTQRQQVEHDTQKRTSGTLAIWLVVLSALLIILGLVILLLRRQKKLKELRIKRQIKSKANRELNKQKFELRKQQKSLRI